MSLMNTVLAETDLLQTQKVFTKMNYKIERRFHYKGFTFEKACCLRDNRCLSTLFIIRKNNGTFEFIDEDLFEQACQLYYKESIRNNKSNEYLDYIRKMNRRRRKDLERIQNLNNLFIRMKKKMKKY